MKQLMSMWANFYTYGPIAYQPTKLRIEFRDPTTIRFSLNRRSTETLRLNWIGIDDEFQAATISTILFKMPLPILADFIENRCGELDWRWCEIADFMRAWIPPGEST